MTRVPDQLIPDGLRINSWCVFRGSMGFHSQANQLFQDGPCRIPGARVLWWGLCVAARLVQARGRASVEQSDPALSLEGTLIWALLAWPKLESGRFEVLQPLYGSERLGLIFILFNLIVWVPRQGESFWPPGLCRMIKNFSSSLLLVFEFWIGDHRLRVIIILKCTGCFCCFPEVGVGAVWWKAGRHFHRVVHPIYSNEWWSNCITAIMQMILDEKGSFWARVFGFDGCFDGLLAADNHCRRLLEILSCVHICVWKFAGDRTVLNSISTKIGTIFKNNRTYILRKFYFIKYFWYNLNNNIYIYRLYRLYICINWYGFEFVFLAYW